MKSVLISIRPQWCALIARGRKTIELRKTRPKIDAHFKCYIYQCQPRYGDWNERDGKVIGEFLCDKIVTYPANSLNQKEREFCYDIPERCLTALSYKEIYLYGNGKTIYGWHISDLKIYDKPKDLDDFMAFGKSNCNQKNCRKCLYMGIDGECDIKNVGQPITRPPQSWCYVEENNNDD